MKLRDIIDEIEDQAAAIFGQVKIPERARLGRAAFAEFNKPENWYTKDTLFTKPEDTKEVDDADPAVVKEFQTSGGGIRIDLDESLGPEEIVVE